MSQCILLEGQAAILSLGQMTALRELNMSQDDPGNEDGDGEVSMSRMPDERRNAQEEGDGGEEKEDDCAREDHGSA